MKASFSVEFQSVSDDISQALLAIIESVVDEANTTDVEPLSVEKDSAHMTVILEKLSSHYVPSGVKPKQVVKTMTRVIPFLTYGVEKTMSILVDYFNPHLSLTLQPSSQDKTDDSTLQQSVFYLNCFVNIVENIKLDSNGAKLKDYLLSRGMINLIILFILEIDKNKYK